MDGHDLTPPTVPSSSTAAVLDPADPALAPDETGAADQELGLDLGPARPWWWPLKSYPGNEEASVWLRRAVSVLVVIGCGIYVFWVVHPELVLRNTTPTGGDMGA